MNQVDIAVIGAGIAGLTCAQMLQQLGYQVVILEKSRGVGGRLATRRLHGTIADHGTCYLSLKGELLRSLIQRLTELDIVQAWTDKVYELDANRTLRSPAPEDVYPRYAAPDGMTAIAKFLADGLDIRLSQRVINLALTDNHTWQLTSETTNSEANRDSAISTLTAQAVVVAIPTPQAVLLLQPLEESVLSAEFLNQLQSVEFAPCISVMAGYAAERFPEWTAQYPDVTAIAPVHHPDLAWIGLDSSKRRSRSQPVFVLQSTTQFAQGHLDAPDVVSAGQSLLQQAGRLLTPWLETPDWLQVHRWRYAFAVRPLPQHYLTADTPIPLVCSGDWCGGMRVESALLSGLETAGYLNHQLHDRPTLAAFIWDAIAHHSSAPSTPTSTKTP